MMKRFYELLLETLNRGYQAAYRYFKKNEDDRVMIFRLIVLCLWINLLAIFILVKINPVQLLNPYKFGQIPPEDGRKQITLFYPASIDDLHEKSGSDEKSNLVEIHQSANVDENYDSLNKKELIIHNAWEIVQQLASPPSSIRGVRAIKDELLVKSIWFYEGQLIVHLDKSKIGIIKEAQRNILLACIRKSLQANLGAFTEVVIVTQ